MTKLRAIVTQLEKSKLGEQLFRAARLGAVAVVTGYFTGSVTDVTGAVVVFEVAFRAAFPS